MPMFLLVAAGILLVVAWKNTQGDLLSALATDVPGFAKWALALAALGGLGFIPGLKIPSRWMLTLVLLVLFLGNYQKALAGFADATSTAAQGAASADNPDPATKIAANPRSPGITQASVSGTTDQTANATSVSAPAGQSSPTDPAHFLTAYLEQAGVAALLGA